MTHISWNEVRDRAIHFSRECAGTSSESAEKQTFWNEFFEVFGLRRRSVATFEEPVQRIHGTYGKVDLFWPGLLLVEHKSCHSRTVSDVTRKEGEAAILWFQQVLAK